MTSHSGQPDDIAAQDTVAGQPAVPLSASANAGSATAAPAVEVPVAGTPPGNDLARDKSLHNAASTARRDAPVSHGAARHVHDLSHMLFTASVPGTEIKKQISYIAPGQTAKALILIYLTFSVPIVLLATLIGSFSFGQIEIGSVFKAIFSALILNAVAGFVLLWVACQAYNWVASRFGGIEIVLSDTPEEL